MTASMPRTTKVLGYKFAVRVVRGLVAHEEDEHMDVLGLCDSDDQVIVLEKDQGPDRLRDTYLHEHLHAMLDLTGLRNELGPNRTEDLVLRLSPVLLLFLRENPRVYTYLTGRRLW